jgi:2TM family of unknown function (DUF5676)
MEGMNPWLAGAALAITFAISFAACTLVFVAYPDASVEFLNASFHGLDFRKLQPAAGGFSLAGFGTVIVVWALALRKAVAQEPKTRRKGRASMKTGAPTSMIPDCAASLTLAAAVTARVYSNPTNWR